MDYIPKKWIRRRKAFGNRSVWLVDTNGKWGFKVRMLCATLPKYGGNAKEALAQLKADPRFEKVQQGRFKGIWDQMVKAIEEDENPPALISVQEAIEAGKGNKR